MIAPFVLLLLLQSSGVFSGTNHMGSGVKRTLPSTLFGAKPADFEPSTIENILNKMLPAKRHFRHEVDVVMPDEKREQCIGAVINATELIIPSNIGGLFNETCQDGIVIPVTIIYDDPRGKKIELNTNITNCQILSPHINQIRIENEIPFSDSMVEPIRLWYDRKHELKGYSASILIYPDERNKKGEEIQFTIYRVVSELIYVKITRLPRISRGSTLIKKISKKEYRLVGMYVGHDITITTITTPTTTTISKRTLAFAFTPDKRGRNFLI